MNSSRSSNDSSKSSNISSKTGSNTGSNTSNRATTLATGATTLATIATPAVTPVATPAATLGTAEIPTSSATPAIPATTTRSPTIMIFARPRIFSRRHLSRNFTKLPQGGGVLVNNLRVMGCFLSSPPLQFPPKVILFDLNEAIFGTREYYFLQPTIIGNVIHGPMPRPDAKRRPTAASSSPFPPPNAAFAFPAFPLPFAFF